MYTPRKIALALVTSTLMFGAVTSSVQACGFVGCLVNKVAPGVGTALDHANAAAGKPFDHAAAAVANTVVPGSGVAMEGYWAARDAGLVPSIPNRGFQAAPNFNGGGAGSVTQFNGGGYMPVNNVAVGYFCSTPYGRVGPGPANMVGASCFTVAPNGQAIFGQVTQ